MIQRRIPGTSAAWAKCPSCGNLPRHIETSGRSKRETMDWSIPTLRHSLECRCGRATARHATLSEAEQQWGLCDDQLSLPIKPPAPVTHIQRGRKRGKAVRS